MMCRFAWALGCASFVVLPAPVVNAQEASKTPDAAIDQRLNEQVPLDLVFRDERGKDVTLGKYFTSKPVVLVLAYYRCPRLCSLVLNGLVESLRNLDYEIGNQFTVITVSFDPREKPALAAAKKVACAEQYGRPGAQVDWHFLTGDEPAIKSLTGAVGFRYFYDAKRDQFAHASGIMILTPEGKIARYYYGIEFAPRELRFGLEDASAGKIGSPITRPLRLLCYEYDPATGKYSLMTLRLVRMGGILTIVGLVTFWLWCWRRQRRKAANAVKGTA